MAALVRKRKSGQIVVLEERKEALKTPALSRTSQADSKRRKEGGPRLRLRPRLAHHNGPRHGGLECGAEVQQPLLVVLA